MFFSIKPYDIDRATMNSHNDFGQRPARLR